LSKKTSLRAEPVSYMKATLDRLKLGNMLEGENTKEKLSSAGYRGQAPLITFMFFRFVMPFIVFAVTLFYMFVVLHLSWPPLQKIGVAFIGALIGFYLPDLFVNNMIQRRQTSIMRAFPDALDLMLICVESGMSIESAFTRVASEIGSQSPELAEELALTTAELSYLPDRRAAFDNLAKRCGHSGVRAVATALNQAEKYGTPLGSALRVTATENREMRMQEAERKAASLPAKLTVPMIVFFLPCLFVVIMGPAIITIKHMMH
jgi:tight adherence protein C